MSAARAASRLLRAGGEARNTSVAVAKWGELIEFIR